MRAKVTSNVRAWPRGRGGGARTWGRGPRVRRGEVGYGYGVIVIIKSAYTPVPYLATSSVAPRRRAPLALGRTSIFGGVNLCSSSALPTSLTRAPLWQSVAPMASAMVGAARGRVRYGGEGSASGESTFRLSRSQSRMPEYRR